MTGPYDPGNLGGLPADWLAVVRLPIPVQQLVKLADMFPGTVLENGGPDLDVNVNVLVVRPDPVTDQEGPTAP